MRFRTEAEYRACVHQSYHGIWYVIKVEPTVVWKEWERTFVQELEKFTKSPLQGSNVHIHTNVESDPPGSLIVTLHVSLASPGFKVAEALRRKINADIGNGELTTAVVAHAMPVYDISVVSSNAEEMTQILNQC